VAKVKCPGCKADVEVDPKKGQTVECDECGKTFRLAVKKPAAAGAAVAGAPRKAAPPPDDDDDDDDEPVKKVKKKKKVRRSSSGPPVWLFPVIGFVVIAAIALTIVFVVVPVMKRGLLFDPMVAITDDVDEIAVVRPKGVSGASGMSAMMETMKGGGSHYAPTPPEGFGFEPGHVVEAIRVKKGLKGFYIIKFGWKARPSTPAVATHRDVPIRSDQPKHLDKPRFIVTGSNEMALYDTVEDAKAGIDKMLDGKKAGYCPEPKYAAYFTRTPGKMQVIFTNGMGPDIDKPKTVYAELDYKEYDYKVVYTLDYGTPEAAKAAVESVKKCHEGVRKEIGEWWKKNPEHVGNPFDRVETLMGKPIETDGGKVIFVLAFSKASAGPGLPLMHHAFSMGDAPPGGFDDDNGMRIPGR
jgi:hypothetical protein